jgi:DNA-binding response OmpR family regulator
MKGHVLVVSKDLGGACRVRNMLNAHQYKARMARRGDDALALLNLRPVEALIVNPCLSDHDVQWLYQRIGERYPRLKEHLIFVVDGDLPEDVKTFIEGTGNDILSMPVEGDQLDEALSHHVRRYAGAEGSGAPFPSC